MSWDFWMTRPGHGLANLQARLHAVGDDGARRLLVAGDALLQLGFEPQWVCDALRLLRGDVLDVSWFSMREEDPDAYHDHLNLEANYTYNVSPMFYEAFDLRKLDGTPAGIRGLDGRTGDEAGKALDVAIQRMEADPDRFEKMNPENGWGDCDGALELLRKLRGWCAEYPDAVMCVS